MSVEDEGSHERSLLLPSSERPGNLKAGRGGVDEVESEVQPLSAIRGLAIISSIEILIFVLTSNVSLLTTIQSPIATELRAFSSASWFTSAYLIAVTSITPAVGRLSKIFTPRIYLFASIVVQSLGLLLTSLAPSLWVFLVGRVLTGAGSAAVTPIAFILVTELTTQARRGLFFGLINTGYTAGVALGAIIAGALEPAVGWRAVFWLQIPLTLSAATMALLAIPVQARERATKGDLTVGERLSKIDYFGMVTLTSSVVLLLYSLSLPDIPATPIVLSALMLCLFILVESAWAHEPIIPTSVLTSRANILTGLSTVGLMSARWSVLFYSPVYAISVRGWSQASAGLMLLPTNAGFAIGGILAGWLHIRKAGSFYSSALVCFFLFGVLMIVVAQISTSASNIWCYVTMLFLNGFIVGALLNYSLAHLLHLTSPVTHVIVIPLNAMFRSLSGSFGSSMSGGLFLRTLKTTLESGFAERGMLGKSELIDRLLGTPVLVNELTGLEKEVAIDGYQMAFKTLFMVGSAIAFAMALVQAGTGWTAPPDDGDGDTLSNPEVLSPTASRDIVAN